MKSVIIFLSTPRCGTQWIAKNLSDFYSERAVTLHEPIKYEYYLRYNLGRFDKSLKPSNNKILTEHLEYIFEETKSRKYIEVGWQSIAGVSQLHKRFGNRLRLIHLYRNPVEVAASLVTHNWYTGKGKERSEKAELTPFDNVSLLGEYRERWDDLNLFEKSLYYWTEINLCAKNLEYRYDEVPFYSLKFENLFKKNKETSRIYLAEMLSFIGLDYDGRMLESIDIHYDEYHYCNTTNLSLDWTDIFRHPQTIALANKLGYRFNDELDLKRYKKKSYSKKIINRIKKLIGK